MHDAGYGKMREYEDEPESESYSTCAHLPEEDEDSTDEEEMRRLQEELVKLRKSALDSHIEYAKATIIWTTKLNHLKDELEQKTYEVDDLKKQIEEKENAGPPPPGPPCLDFVDGDAFLVAGLAVIVTNIVTITMEAVDEHYAAELFWMDQLFLVFYTIELTLKALYHQRSLLCGPISVVWWNWLDLVIVVVGTFSAWVLPFIEASSSDSAGPSYVGYLRVLRLARLVRVLKLIRVVIQSNFRWAEGDVFQTFILGIIAFNAILMGVEMEMPQFDCTWFYVNQVLLVIFTFELLVRFRLRGCFHFFFGKEVIWNILDLIIVVGGVMDQWLMPLAEWSQSTQQQVADGESFSSNGTVSSVMNLLRMARLLRILRLVRLIRGVPQLYTLALGVAKAMQGMAWVMVLTLTVLYICALVGVKLAGPSGLLWVDKKKMDPEIFKAFPNLWGAIFNLFKVMNADFSSVEALLNYSRVSKYFLMFYVVVTNWAIFSILTAVVSDHMKRATDEFAQSTIEEEKFKKMDLLNDTFQSLDTDVTGNISEKELRAFLDNTEESEIVCKAADLSPDDIKDFFEIVSHKQGYTEDGEEAVISRAEFLGSLMKQGDSVKQRTIMRLERRVDSLQSGIDASMRRVKATLMAAAGAQSPPGKALSFGMHSPL